jgi:hypothetical protein
MTVAETLVLTASTNKAKMALAHIRCHTAAVHTALAALRHAAMGQLITRIAFATLASNKNNYHNNENN